MRHETGGCSCSIRRMGRWDTQEMPFAHSMAMHSTKWCSWGYSPTDEICQEKQGGSSQAAGPQAQENEFRKLKKEVFSCADCNR
jgi:hypothetical protein